jgi:arginase
VIGVPFNSSGVAGGEAAGPKVLRKEGLVAALRRRHDVVDAGDVVVPPSRPDRDPLSGIIAPDVLVAMVDAVAVAVGSALADDRLPVVVGGDCPLLLGCLQAAGRHVGGEVRLLFVDGHEDAYPPHTSLTGEAADMELGMALGLTTVTGLPALSDRLPLVAVDDVIVLGPRDLAEIRQEGAASIRDRVTVLDDVELRERDIHRVVGDWVDATERAGRRFWLHLDLDSLTSVALPAVSYLQPGGLDWDELDAIGRRAVASPALLGIDVTIYNPDLDPTREGAMMIVNLLRGLLDP